MEKYCYSLTQEEFASSDLVGEYALQLMEFKQLSLGFSPGFVVAAKAFDDFLVANELVDNLLIELDKAQFSNSEDISEIARRLQTLIISGKMHQDLLKQIAKYYEGLSDKKVQVQQSPLNSSLSEYSYASFKKYLVKDVESLVAKIKQKWADLFCQQALEYRKALEYEGNLSQAVVVQSLPTVESSGRIYNFDAAAGDLQQLTIAAELGLKPIKEGFIEEKIADFYLLDKKKPGLQQDKQQLQKFMLIKGDNEPNSEIVKEVKVSNNWAAKEKLSETMLERLKEIVFKLEKGRNGKFAFNYSIYDKEILLHDLIIKQDTDTELAGFTWDNVDNPDDRSFELDDAELKQLVERSKADLVLNDEDAQAKADSLANMLPEIKTVTDVWWEPSKKAEELRVFTNVYDGIGVINLYEVAERVLVKQPEQLKRFSELKTPKKQVAQYLSRLAVNAAPKPLVVQLSRKLLVEAQAETLTILKGEYQQRNLRVILPRFERKRDIRQNKQALTGAGFKRTAQFHIYQLVSQPLLLSNLDAIYDEGLDGAVLDVDKLYARLLVERKLELKQDEENLELFRQYLRRTITPQETDNLYLGFTSSKQFLRDYLLDDLIELGFNAIVYGGDELVEFKHELEEREAQHLTRSLQAMSEQLKQVG